MADQDIAFLLGDEHAYQSMIVTATQSKGGTSFTKDALHYDLKEKRPLRERYDS
ncbi:hypothetical protein Syun_019095 [Stephania yunnanensis]|uniref:Uncharacterized protein n=1 Tax=Stephania yunnanensis TaxID=152371 RepID=A0AAP0NWD3_9MAGN